MEKTRGRHQRKEERRELEGEGIREEKRYVIDNGENVTRNKGQIALVLRLEVVKCANLGERG